MKNFSETKTILFDFGGTIDSDGIAWKEHFEPLYHRAGIVWNQEKFDRCFYFSDDFLTGRGLKKTGYSTMLRRQVGLVLKQGGAYNLKLRNKIAEAFMQNCFRNFKRNAPLLRELSKKYKLGIVSNFYGNLPHLLKEVGLARYFGAVIDSRWQGCIKPDAAIFNAALNLLNARVRETVFVGDSLKRDMAGAKNLNMAHIWLNPQPKFDDKRCCAQDKIIRTFLDLERIFL